MAHVDTVYEAETGRWTVDEHVCAESLNDDWCPDWCGARGHTYYVVAEIDDEGYGEIHPNSFVTAGEAKHWAEDYFGKGE